MAEGSADTYDFAVPSHWNHWVVPSAHARSTWKQVQLRVAAAQGELLVVKKRTRLSEADRGLFHAWLEGYEPMVITYQRWQVVRSFVLATMTRLDPPSFETGRQETPILTQLASWCVDHGIEIEAENVLDPDTVEQFIAGLDKPVHTAATYRSYLRRMGPILTTRAPWQPAPAGFKRRTITAPYTSCQIAQYERYAAAQNTAHRRRVGEMLLVLGLGAGLDGRWNVHVRPIDIDDLGFGLVIDVDRPPRRVPVLAEYEDRLWNLVLSCDSEFLHGNADSKNIANHLARLVKVPPGVPPLASNRLRASWLVAHLARSTRFPELLNAAGLDSPNTLLDLLPYITRLPDEEAFRLLRRPLAP